MISVACGSPAGDGSLDGIAGDEHRIFITSAATTGALDGLEGADAICQAAAAQGGLSRSYKAILGDSATLARDRLSLFGEVVSIDASGQRETIVALGNMLWGSSLETTIKYDQFGNFVSGQVWSGTDSNGGNAAGTLQNCSDWTSQSPGTQGSLGDTTSTFGFWIEDASPATCDQSMRLYCISQ